MNVSLICDYRKMTRNRRRRYEEDEEERSGFQLDNPEETPDHEKDDPVQKDDPEDFEGEAPEAGEVQNGEYDKNDPLDPEEDMGSMYGDPEDSPIVDPDRGKPGEEGSEEYATDLNPGQGRGTNPQSIEERLGRIRELLDAEQVGQDDVGSMYGDEEDNAGWLDLQDKGGGQGADDASERTQDGENPYYGDDENQRRQDPSAGAIDVDIYDGAQDVTVRIGEGEEISESEYRRKAQLLSNVGMVAHLMEEFGFGKVANSIMEQDEAVNDPLNFPEHDPEMQGDRVGGPMQSPEVWLKGEWEDMTAEEFAEAVHDYLDFVVGDVPEEAYELSGGETMVPDDPHLDRVDELRDQIDANRDDWNALVEIWSEAIQQWPHIAWFTGPVAAAFPWRKALKTAGPGA